MPQSSSPLQRLLSEARDLLPSKANKLQKAMLEILCGRISEDDVEFFDAQILSQMAQTHWDMARQHRKGEPQIKIYSPVYDKGDSRKTVIDFVGDDMAFLVDSIAAEVNKNNLLIGILIHPILYPIYDKKGELQDITSTQKSGAMRQSHIHIQINQKLSPEAMQTLEKGLYDALKDVFVANQDWLTMREKLKFAAHELAHAKTRRPADEVIEYCGFLEYLYNNNFTLLGYREYQFVEGKDGIKSRTVKGAGLGLLREDVSPAYISESEEGLPRNLQELRRSLPPVSISKTNRLATVHRRVPMDCVAVKMFDGKGKVVGEKLFLGLFTSVTYSRSVSDVPYLRNKVEEVILKSGYLEGSHNRKALRHILEKYPRDELFQIETDELLTICQDIIRLQERQRIALFLRVDPFGRYISCLVYVPRDRFGTTLRKAMEAILEQETQGKCVNFYTSLDDSVFARVMYVLNISQKNPPKIKPKRLEAMLREAGQTWPEKLSVALAEAYKDDARNTTLMDMYSEAFPVGYTTNYLAKHAVFDIEKIDCVLQKNRMVLDFYRPGEMDPKNVRLKLYNIASPVTLSDVLPILENMGLRSIAELPFEIEPKGFDKSIWIHDFLLEASEAREPIIIEDVKQNFEKSFAKIWYGEVENDTLNKLVISAGTNWHEITILRTYTRYMRQLRVPFSVNYIEKALTENPKISRLIVDLFKAYHDPLDGAKLAAKAGALCASIEQELEKVTSSDYDRILRVMTGLVEATLRTNYFQRAADGSAKPYLSMKFDCSKIADMPAPKPFREIYVYSPRMEGIHLRGDKIARGGIRWSDRHEDYRTEVLGLMKAQMVKNSVIVPMGAKGGFVVKTPTHSREEFLKEGIECYKTLVRGLLDITDNQDGAKIIPPQSVVRRDSDDPYLVVAADKGTATFSDIANGLSKDYNFWLGDAFASGGSAGYDHKKMGITARGAWESVKSHFRHFNHDIQSQPFDVAGVGDMGGDVFGNGMLLSEKIRLVAAFNHVHIFVDPEPDMAVSFKERKRLFENILGWDHYNEKLLSKGGRVYKRSDKTVILTPEIMKRLDITKEKITPAELMKAILKSRVELMWFGGIGTYIKSTKENHTDAGDKANDATRISASELRARVVGEGANLGITQLGRIELAEKGVRLNTDFLDNSGGVDSSDHEVNIKILMTDAMSVKENNMDLKARNKILESMTEEVAEHVLRHNYQQTLAISLAEFQGRENLQLQDEFIQDMEREQGLRRELEGLPDRETIELRLRTGKGLTRPELCILLAYAKITLTQELLATDIPDSPDMEYWLVQYFPDILGKKFRTEMNRHRLKRQIIATMMANSLVNRMGPTFVKSRMNKTGASAAEVALSYILVREAFGLRALWDKIEALDGKVPAEVQLKAMREIAHLSEHAITWFITRLGRSVDMKTDSKEFGSRIKILSENLEDMVTEGLRTVILQRAEAAVRDGLPKELAHEIAFLPVLSSACDIIRIAMEQGTDLKNTARTYFELGERFHLAWLRQQARYLPQDDHWQREAASGLMDQLFACQAGITVRILRDINGSAKKLPQGESIVEKWLEKSAHQVKQLDPFFAGLRRAGTVDLTMLTVAEQRLRGLYST